MLADEDKIVSLRTSSSLLSIVARKIWHDIVLLRSTPELSKVKCCTAVFANCTNYYTPLVRANRKCISLKYIDSKDNIRANGSMYDELVRMLYKILENGGHVSDGRKRLNASMVPDFMINCAMGGYS